VPASTGAYEASTAQISQIEDPRLNPVFGDLLSPAATAPVKVTVQSAITKLKIEGGHGKTLVRGSVAPGTGHVKAIVTVLARPAGSKGRFRKRASERLRTNKSKFSLSVRLPARMWQIKVTYHDRGQVLPATSRPANVTVSAK
jgi:hypothetical protein